MIFKQEQITELLKNIPIKTKIMGIDYGIKKLGIALSDPTHIISSPHSILIRKEDDIETDIKKIKDIIKDNNVKTIIIGLPINMDGSKGEAVDKVEKFASKLDELLHGNDEEDLLISFWDERLSSKIVQKNMRDAGVKRKDRDNIDDKLAACYILQSFLDRKAMGLAISF